MTINCCRECDHRSLGCHGSCVVYQERLKEYRAGKHAVKEMYKFKRSARTIQLTNKRGVQNAY